MLLTKRLSPRWEFIVGHTWSGVHHHFGDRRTGINSIRLRRISPTEQPFRDERDQTIPSFMLRAGGELHIFLVSVRGSDESSIQH
jgi:hypothetical protein